MWLSTVHIIADGQPDIHKIAVEVKLAASEQLLASATRMPPLEFTEFPHHVRAQHVAQGFYRRIHRTAAPLQDLSCQTAGRALCSRHRDAGGRQQ